MTADNKALKITAHLRVSNEIAKQLQSLQEKQAAEAEAVKALTPEAIQACVASERIFGHQAEAVTEKLASSHLACLEFIRDLAKHRNAAELESIGKPVGQEKKASNPITGGHVADWDETLEGDAFRQKLTGATSA